jgi:hypothetical protein
VEHAVLLAKWALVFNLGEISQNFEERLLASSCLFICLCFLPSVWNNSAPTEWIFVILIIRAFLLKSVQIIQVSVESGNNNGHFPWPIYIYDNISLNSPWNEGCFKHNLYRNSKNIVPAQNSNPPPPPKIEVMLNNKVEPNWPQTTMQYGACVLHAGYPRLQARPHDIWFWLLFHRNIGYANAPLLSFITRLDLGAEFMNITPCWWVNNYRGFVMFCCFHVHGG